MSFIPNIYINHADTVETNIHLKPQIHYCIPYITVDFCYLVSFISYFRKATSAPEAVFARQCDSYYTSLLFCSASFLSWLLFFLPCLPPFTAAVSSSRGLGCSPLPHVPHSLLFISQGYFDQQILILKNIPCCVILQYRVAEFQERLDESYA